MTEPTPSQTYVLGHSEAELRRLKAQAQEIDPVSRRFVTEAGIGPGMRVLDVGTGAGDTALLLADVVGPQGEVVGIDRSATGLEAGRAKVAERSLHNVSFVQGDADELTFDEPFDAVFGRYVLQFQQDPARLLAAVAAHVRPGGLVVFHELDWSGAVLRAAGSHVRPSDCLGGRHDRAVRRRSPHRPAAARGLRSCRLGAAGSPAGRFDRCR